MKKKDRSREGVCKLTGLHGRFVDSHLIPLALTRLSRSGEKHVESGIGLGIKSRSNSWYDAQLVTRDGEDILAAIDARAIEALRQCKLVWSGWDDNEDLSAKFSFSDQGTGIRELEFFQTDDLQVFFLSLLWRAAASTRHEFADLSLPTSMLEDLRVRVLKQDPGPYEDYPVQLFQLTTRGFAHNRTPLVETKRMPLTTLGWGDDVEYARFYFDGLISHIHLPKGTHFESEYLQSCLGLGQNGNTVVFGHKFEESRTLANIQEMVGTVVREHWTLPSRLSEIASAARELVVPPLVAPRNDSDTSTLAQ